MAASAGGGLGALGWSVIAVGAAAVGGAALYVTGAFGPEPAESVASAPQEQVAEPAATPTPEPVAEAPTAEPEAEEAAPVIAAEPEVTPEPAPEVHEEVETAALAPEPTAEPAPEATADPEPEAPATKPAAEEQAEAPAELAPTPEVETITLAAPSFDVVRVEPDGTTVIAGSATEGSRVTVFVDGVSQDSFDILPGGQFVSFLTIGVSDAPRVLTLQAELDQQVMASVDSIILAPSPRAPEPETAIATATPEVTEDPAPQVTAEETTQEAPAAQTAAAPEPASEAPVETAQAETPAEEAPVETATEQPAAEAQPEQVASAPSEQTSSPAEQPATTLTETATAPAPSTPEPAADPVVEEEQLATAEPVEESASQEHAAEEKPAEQPATAPVTETVVASEQTASEPAQPAAEPAQPTAVAVLRAGADGVELIQPATPQPAETQGKVTLDTISYSETGDVVLAGRGAPQAVVRTYLNNQAVADFAVAQDSRWRGELVDIKPGIYTLRLDELDLSGKILSRLETPFKREAPEVLRPATQPAPQPAVQEAGAEQPAPAPTPVIRAVTVQKGDTLWAISQDRYGEGLLYVRVFEANRQAIRDPDLIYPGQVFTIPE